MAKTFRPRLHIAWQIMALLSFFIAIYAFIYFFVDAIGGDLKEKFATMPLAARAHIWGGGIALLTGAFQMNTALRRKNVNLHRWLGRVYLLSILAGAGGGLYLAWHAEGGVGTKLGFGLLGIAWLVTGVFAFWHIKKHEIAAHRRWMVRNFALTFAAVTLRILLPALLMSGLAFPVAYLMVSWLCWVPNLVVAEWLFIRRPARRSARSKALG